MSHTSRRFRTPAVAHHESLQAMRDIHLYFAGLIGMDPRRDAEDRTPVLLPNVSNNFQENNQGFLDVASANIEEEFENELIRLVTKRDEQKAATLKYFIGQLNRDKSPRRNLNQSTNSQRTPTNRRATFAPKTVPRVKPSRQSLPRLSVPANFRTIPPRLPEGSSDGLSISSQAAAEGPLIPIPEYVPKGSDHIAFSTIGRAFDRQYEMERQWQNLQPESESDVQADEEDLIQWVDVDEYNQANLRRDELLRKQQRF